MFCGNCGSEIPDNAKFCPRCGAYVQIETEEPDWAPQYDEEDEENSSQYEEDREPRGNRRGLRALIIIIIIAAIVVVAFFLLRYFGVWDQIRGRTEEVVEEEVIEAEETVEEPEGAEYFDAFEDISVEFSGISPNAEAALTVGEGELDADAYSISPTSGLSIGDTVTVSINEEAAESLEQETGRYPEEMSRDYTVEGIAYCVSSLDEIPDEAMEEMKDYAEQVKTEKADSWSHSVHKMNSLDYVGCYFLYEDPDTEMEDANILYLVYKLNVTKFGKNEDGSDENTTFDYYWYAGYTNAMILEDGSFFVDYEDFTEPEFGSTSSFDVVTYDYTQKDPDDQKIKTGYRGYQDLDTLYTDLIEPLLDDYTCESTVP